MPTPVKDMTDEEVVAELEAGTAKGRRLGLLRARYEAPPGGVEPDDPIEAAVEAVLEEEPVEVPNPNKDLKLDRAAGMTAIFSAVINGNRGMLGGPAMEQFRNNCEAAFETLELAVQGRDAKPLQTRITELEIIEHRYEKRVKVMQIEIDTATAVARGAEEKLAALTE